MNIETFCCALARLTHVAGCTLPLVPCTLLICCLCMPYCLFFAVSYSLCACNYSAVQGQMRGEERMRQGTETWAGMFISHMAWDSHLSFLSLSFTFSLSLSSTTHCTFCTSRLHYLPHPTPLPACACQCHACGWDLPTHCLAGLLYLSFRWTGLGPVLELDWTLFVLGVDFALGG